MCLGGGGGMNAQASIKTRSTALYRLCEALQVYGLPLRDVMLERFINVYVHRQSATPRGRDRCRPNVYNIEKEEEEEGYANVYVCVRAHVEDVM